MKIIILFAATSTALACFFASVNAVAQVAPSVEVTAWGMHRGGMVVYKYQVKNLGASPIDDFFIGFHPPVGSVDGAAELNEGPYYPESTSLWLSQSVSQSPAGWGVYLSFPEESATFSLRWVEAGHYRDMWPKARGANIPIAQNPPNLMPPGAIWDQFSVTLPKPDYAYVQGHAYLFYGHNEITVPMVKGDTIPPILTVRLSPNKLWPPNDKLVPITATIAVKDNYDPQPEVILESITSNEALESGDIQGAQYGTDDRQFLLKAEREGTIKAGRIYTVTYSATDASGNKATASATVTVPHDNDEKEKNESKEKEQSEGKRNR